MLKIQYRDAKDGGIEVLRCFSKEDQVEIPSEIEGKRVTKIGDYAFSAHTIELLSALDMLILVILLFRSKRDYDRRRLFRQ